MKRQTVARRPRAVKKEDLIRPSQPLKSFSKKTPALQLAWDATSLQSFMACPRRYQYEIVEGWRRKERTHHTDFGSFYHAAIDAHDRAKIAGKSKEEATDIALAEALRLTWVNDAPWDSGDDYKNRHNLIRMVVWYCDEQPENGGVLPYVFPNGQPAVELSFKVPLPLKSRDGEPFLLCGHMDSICTLGDEVFVRERKTTKTSLSSAFFYSYSPNVQIDTYALVSWLLWPALRIRGVMVEAGQVAKSFSRFLRQPIYHTEAQRDEWLQSIMNAIQRAEQCARDNYWPMNTAVCNLYGGCPYRTICGLDPDKRDLFLRKSGDFKQHVWDPIVER